MDDPDGSGTWYSSSTTPANGEVFSAAKIKHIIPAVKELFCFGEGDWAEDTDATSCMNNPDAAWLPLDIKDDARIPRTQRLYYIFS